MCALACCAGAEGGECISQEQACAKDGGTEPHADRGARHAGCREGGSRQAGEGAFSLQASREVGRLAGRSGRANELAV
eukprot:1160461-Pelagomonas_calceolata.AAC.8